MREKGRVTFFLRGLWPRLVWAYGRGRRDERVTGEKGEIGMWSCVDKEKRRGSEGEERGKRQGEREGGVYVFLYKVW